MNYNSFVRIYYNLLIEALKKYELRPTIEFGIQEDDEQFSEIFFEERDCGEIAMVGIKQSAPNFVFEKWFEKKHLQYPEMDFFMNKEQLVESSKDVETIEDVRKLLDLLLFVAKQGGWIYERNRTDNEASNGEAEEEKENWYA